MDRQKFTVIIFQNFHNLYQFCFHNDKINVLSISWVYQRSCISWLAGSLFVTKLLCCLAVCILGTATSVQVLISEDGSRFTVTFIESHDWMANHSLYVSFCLTKVKTLTSGVNKIFVNKYIRKLLKYNKEHIYARFDRCPLTFKVVCFSFSDSGQLNMYLLLTRVCCRVSWRLLLMLIW